MARSSARARARRLGLCGSNPFQRRADWGITAGRETARKSCHRVSHTGDANRNGESGEGSLMSSPVIAWLKSTSSSGSVIVTSEPPVLWENLLRTSSQVPKLRHRCHRCSEKSGCGSSRFVSIGTVPHPLETIDPAIEATTTTASNGTPRGKTYAFDSISTKTPSGTQCHAARKEHSCTQENSRMQGRRNHGQTNGRRSTITIATRGQQAQRKHTLEPASPCLCGSGDAGRHC